MHKIKNNLNLNPKIWDFDKSLRPEVAEILTRIYISFMTILSKYSGVPLDIEKDVIDVIFCGSSVEYFYNKNSDIDITIIIKPDRYLKQMHPDIFDRLIGFIQNFFTTKYSPNIYGIKVDINLSALNDNTFARYSLIQNKWLREPTRLSDQEIKEIEKEYNKIYTDIRKDIICLLKDKSRYGEITKIIYELTKKRADSWNGSIKDYLPFSRAYSSLVRSGLIRKMLSANINVTKKMIVGK